MAWVIWEKVFNIVFSSASTPSLVTERFFQVNCLHASPALLSGECEGTLDPLIMTNPSAASAANLPLIEDMYDRWRNDPQSVDPSWTYFFDGFQAGLDRSGTGPVTKDGSDHIGISRLIRRYRDLGHLVAHLDPLAPPQSDHPLLDPVQFGFTQSDLDRSFDCSEFYGMARATLRELLSALRETYCRTIGAEYMHVQDPVTRQWLAGKMENCRSRSNLTQSDQARTLEALLRAEQFENFLQVKFTGQKRFSLEGGESLIPLLDIMADVCPSLGADEIVLGMAHRGRLNVLVNFMGKPVDEVFAEFEENFESSSMDGDGDVKYHLGYSGDRKTSDGGKVHLSLTPNPSHLEAVNPVVEGRVRAKQYRKTDTERSRVIPLLIHGDAAFAGQGIVAESLNLSNLQGYTTGGTIHVVINNQIGFTTIPADARSTYHCTDVAKIIQAPIFHVNGDDPEAVVYLARLAVEYRQQFKRDVVIDIVCYRKHGHNEGDEPAFTQPLMYSLIRSRQSTPVRYAKHLETNGIVSAEERSRMSGEIDKHLESSLTRERAGIVNYKGMRGFEGTWKGLKGVFSHAPAPTQVAEATVRDVAMRLGTIPNEFNAHPKVREILSRRSGSVKDNQPLDWGTAEAMAMGTLLNEGISVRITGQDVRRGTFSHRHAVLFDTKTNERYSPLSAICPAGTGFEIYDSLLSEAAVLGFEFGYSLDAPDWLVIWEAQFGDFVNGAQTIIDQFISASESKWRRDSGLVMLLPHGYEGQGPEHSSARLERFLQLCAEDNMQVASPTTPSQIYHILRRQMKRNFRKPLIIMSPKSLLRHKAAVSTVAQLVEGSFQEIIDDASAEPSKVKRVVLCCGKVYYDLNEEREKQKLVDVAIVRVEQLYPLHMDRLESVIKRYKKSQQLIWAQEESQNMGAWFFMEPRLRASGFNPVFVGRDASASPATGVKKVHEREQKELVYQALCGNGMHVVGPIGKLAVAADSAATPRDKVSARV